MTKAEHQAPPEAKESSIVQDVKAAEAQNKRSMEDTHYIEMDFGGEKGTVFVGVYDGHGGREAADSAKTVLHNRLMVAITGGLAQEEALKRAYLETSDIIKKNLPETVGCTAATVLIEGNTLYFANVGDAAIIVGGEKTFTKLSQNHKPNEPSERKRIEDQGGIVMSDRVFSCKTYGPKKESRMLNISRALGDASHEGLVVPDPHVGKLELTEDCSDIIVASDGFWRNVSGIKAVKIARQYDNSAEAVEALKQEALKSGVSGDNITVAVIKLNPEALKVEEKPAPPRVEPTPAAPRVEPTPARVEPARPARVEPAAPAREPLSAAEQQLAAKLMKQYQEKYIPEVSAEPYFGERGKTIERVPVEEKRDFASVFQDEMHATMVKNKRDIEMGRRTPEQIAAAMSKEEIFFTYFSDPEHIGTRQDLVGLGHSLTLLMEKRLAAYYGVSEYKFDQEFKGNTQKESDIAFAKFLHTEMGLRTDPALREELANLFWARFGIDRRLRGEKYEEGAARRKEIEFLAIKDQLSGIERWWKGRKIEDTGEYESFVAAFTNTEANRYLDGILKRRMDEMGIIAAAAPEALPTAEEEEVPENMAGLQNIAEHLATEEGLVDLLKALQEIVRTKKELGSKDVLTKMFGHLGWTPSEKFVGDIAGSVSRARKVSPEQDTRSWIFAMLAALIYALVKGERR